MDRDCENKLSDRVMAKLLEGNPIYEASNPDVIVDAFNKPIKCNSDYTIKFRRYKEKHGETKCNLK